MLALILAMQVLAGQAARDSLLVGVRPDGTELWTEEHHFDKRIERFDVIPGTPQMCLNFVEKAGEGFGELGLYDVLERRLCWVSDFDFATDHYVMTSQGVVLQADKTTMLVDDSGRRVWESSFCPLYCDEESGMQDLAYYEKKIGLPAVGFSPDANFPPFKLGFPLLETPITSPR